MEDGFQLVGKNGKHNYFRFKIKHFKKTRFAIQAWMKIKEFAGIYKIPENNMLKINLLSCHTIESSLKEAGLVKYKKNISYFKEGFYFKKRILYLIANGCKNQKLYELLNLAVFKREERLLKKKQNFYKFKLRYL